MSDTAPQRREDHDLFMSTKTFKVRWEGDVTPNSAGTASYYLLRDNKAQGLYVPERIEGSVDWNGVVVDVTNGDATHINETGTFYRDASGNLTYSGGAIGTSDPTVTPTANTTVQALEMVVNEASGTEQCSIVVEGTFYFNYLRATGTGADYWEDAGTSALTTAE